MCFLSDRSIQKKVSLFLPFGRRRVTKVKRCLSRKKFTNNKTVKLIEKSCVFSVSRKNISNSFVLDEENPGSQFALRRYY